MSGSSPVFTPTDLRFAIRAGLFYAEGIAMMGSGCGSGRSLEVWSNSRRGVVVWLSHAGPWNGPAILPCCTSVAISLAMSCQCGSMRCCCSLLWMYCWLCCRSCSMDVGVVYFWSVRTCQLSPGCRAPKRGKPWLSSNCSCLVCGYCICCRLWMRAGICVIIVLCW